MVLTNLQHNANMSNNPRKVLKWRCTFQIIQLIGYCNNVFITEYHKFRSADKLIPMLEQPEYQKYNTLQTRFRFCLNYAKIIEFFHNSPYGTRIMCDTNDLRKLLSQYLVTSDLWLVANDLDALPKVNRTAGLLAKCGPRRIFGDFVAPEQLWPFAERPFSDSEMPGYDEKTDIWKLPDVCEHFLGDIQGVLSVKLHLFKIHKQCKSADPLERPTASEIVKEYMRVKDTLGL